MTTRNPNFPAGCIVAAGLLAAAPMVQADVVTDWNIVAGEQRGRGAA